MTAEANTSGEKLTASGRHCGIRPGMVVLVGAGPGDPDLLTLCAARLIGEADTLVYDRLIQAGVLDLAQPAAEKIYMGKEHGHHTRQDEINALLVEKARAGKRVVRLKGGDPFLFGRGGEEVEYLAEHGIPFDVVPGVSSCLAAPLSAGIAVTHRDASSTVTIVTGHSADGHEDRVDWEAVARNGTAVFLMGVHNIDTIAHKLVAAGRAPETPAAMIQMAYCEGGRVVTATLATIAAEVRRARVEPPATLVVGEVVRLREKLQQMMALNPMKNEAGG
jgi:uroporphyrinogen III methyltransferase/synthase